MLQEIRISQILLDLLQHLAQLHLLVQSHQLQIVLLQPFDPPELLLQQPAERGVFGRMLLQAVLKCGHAVFGGKRLETDLVKVAVYYRLFEKTLAVLKESSGDGSTDESFEGLP